MKAISTSHILMDSWSFSDFLVGKLKQLGLQSICLVKSKLQFKLEKVVLNSFLKKNSLRKSMEVISIRLNLLPLSLPIQTKT